MITHFKINEIGRDYVVGDLHGCFTKLQDKLTKIGFDDTKDRLFSVGDLVDRGPESVEAVKWLNKPWFHAVRGNHEQMLIDVVNGTYDPYGYIQNGGKWFFDLTELEQQNFAYLFDDLPITIEIETKAGLVGIIHAECPVDDWLKLDKELNGEQKDLFKDICLWDRSRAEHNITNKVKNINKIFVGHTQLKKSLYLVM